MDFHGFCEAPSNVGIRVSLQLQLLPLGLPVKTKRIINQPTNRPATTKASGKNNSMHDNDNPVRTVAPPNFATSKSSRASFISSITASTSDRKANSLETNSISAAVSSLYNQEIFIFNPITAATQQQHRVSATVSGRFLRHDERGVRVNKPESPNMVRAIQPPFSKQGGWLFALQSPPPFAVVVASRRTFWRGPPQPTQIGTTASHT